MRAQGYLQGGAVLIQYRDKGADSQRRLQQACAMRDLCRRYQARLIINDDVNLALAVGADGVHLGQDDAELPHARQVLGEQAILGVSCYTSLERAQWAQAQGANYLAFGSFYPSPTKPQAARATLALLRQARTELRLPLVAIGGILPEHVPALIAAGADLVAVISGLQQGNAEASARAYSVHFH